MRPIVLIVAVAAGALAGAACRPPVQPAAVDTVQTFPAAAGKVVRLDLSSLDVEIRVSERPDIRAALRLEARSSSSRAARRWLERHTPTFSDSAAALEIRQPRSGGVFVVGFMHAEGALDLDLPSGCVLEVTTASADVEIDGGVELAGMVSVRTTSGDLRVEGGVHDLTVRTASGDARIDGRPLGLLDFDTASGDLRLDAGAAKVVAESASGDLRLRHLAGDLSVDTGSGDVSAQWDALGPDTAVLVAASSGDIVLRLPEDTSPRGVVRSRSGEVRSRFDGEWDRHRRQLTLRGAGASLTVRTSSGEVVLSVAD